ncbi:MAG: hypothetical protein ACI9UQ_001050 [Candidatus Krumholzibacteriia bacterium]|jgi:hypothetical protein
MFSYRSTWMTTTALMLTLIVLLSSPAFAYDAYSDGGETNCAACHGDFRSNSYISPVDGQDWGNIHSIHRADMLGGDCDACHQSSGRFPVLLDASAGGSGLVPLGCVGCHGRSEDNVVANPSFPNGLGAGLRQHHTNAGINDCVGCHDDADPFNYTTVGEQVLPPYYANPGTGHPDIPTTSCNDDGSEQFAGDTIGLDNDGNHLYDTLDSGCNLSAVPMTIAAGRLLQNHPNPFNPSTTIQYIMNQPGHAYLQVFALTGERVRTLVNRDHDQASTYQVTWNGKGEDGRPVPSGIYFYRLDSPSGVEMKKMVLLK